MIRVLLPAFLLLDGFAAPRIRFKVNETLGLVYFALAASGQPHRSRDLVERFWKSGEPSQADRDALELFRRALRAADIRHSEKDHSRSGADLVETAAVHASSLADLGERLSGFFPVDAQAEILSVLRRFERRYRSRIWQPTVARLKRQTRELERVSVQGRTSDLLGAAARFFDVSWPEGVAVTVGLVPIPGEVKQTNAHGMDAIEVVEVPEKDDLRGRYGVVVHELVHSLWWAADGPERRKKLDAWFASSPYALNELNETLATIVGNVIAEENAGSKPLEDTKNSLYADETIDGFARVLHPVVRDYLREQRVLDEAFAKEASQRFTERFPDAARQVRNALGGKLVILFDDGLEIDGGSPFFDRFVETARIGSLWTSSPILHPKTLQRYRESPSAAAMVVSHPDRLNWLSEFDDLRPACTKLATAAKSAPTAYVARGKSGRLHLVVFARSRDDVKQLLDRIVASKTLPAEGELPR